MAYGYSNLLIELQALNYAFNKNSVSIFTDNYITEDYFDKYKEPFRFLMSFVKQYGQLPTRETFKVKFDTTDKPIEWVDLNTDEPEEYLVKGLRENKAYFDAVKTFNEVGSLLKNNQSFEAAQKMVDSGNRIIRSVPTKSIDLIGDASIRRDSYTEKVNHPETAYAPTGLKELDEVLGGGWDLKNDSVAVCGRTGLGKSWVLVKFASAAVERGFNVGYYSGEMEPDLIGYRLDTFLGNLPNGSLTHGDGQVKEQYYNYIDDLPKHVKGHFYCVTPDTFGCMPTVSMLDSFVEQNHIDFLCIDQLSLLDDQHHAKTPREQYMNISKDLREMQRMKKFPILFAVQLNRESTEDTGGPTTRNIAESDRIGQDATTIIFLERKEENLIVTVGKSRNSKSGSKLTYKWSVNNGILKYLPDEEDATLGASTGESLSMYSGEDDKSDVVF